MNEKTFIENCAKDFQTKGLKSFPLDFIDESQLNKISIPVKTLVIGQEFFGSYEIITTEGEVVYHVLNYWEAKFIVYSSKERNGTAYFPIDKSQTKFLVESYDQYLDSLLNEIKSQFKKEFSDLKNLHPVSNDIFKKLNLIRY